MVGFVVAAVVAGFFIVRAQTLQSDVKQAKDETAQLQTQLQQARTDLGKAQSDAKAMTDETAKLQTQLEQVKSENASAQAATQKASAEAKRLQGQLEQAQKEAADAKARAKKAADELARLQAQMQEPAAASSAATAPAQAKPAGTEATAVKPAASNLKALPLNIAFQKPEVGEGMALMIRNTSTASLTVDVKFSNPAAGAKDYHLVLDPGGSKELGSLGAWILASGDKVEITAAGYNPVVKIAP